MGATEIIRRNATENSQSANDVSDLLNNKDGSLLEDRTAVSGAMGDLRKGLATRNVTDQALSSGMNGFGKNNQMQNPQSFGNLLEEGTVAVMSGAKGDLGMGLATRSVSEISQGAPATPDSLNNKNGSLLEDGTVASGAGRNLRTDSARRNVTKIIEGSSAVEDCRTRLKNGVSCPGRLGDKISLTGRLQNGI